MGPRSRELLARLDRRGPRRRRPSRSPPARSSTWPGARGPGDPDDLRRRARLGAAGAERRARSRSSTRCTSAAPTSALTNAGYSAIESLRLEKGFRAFGRELTPDYTPVEAGLVFATALSRRARTSSAARRWPTAGSGSAARGPRRRLVSFVADDPDAMLWGGELVLRDGEPVGQVTSAAYGATVGASVGLAYLRRDEPGHLRLAGRGRVRGGPGGGAGAGHSDPQGASRVAVPASCVRSAAGPEDERGGQTGRESEPRQRAVTLTRVFAPSLLRKLGVRAHAVAPSRPGELPHAGGRAAVLSAAP